MGFFDFMKKTPRLSDETIIAADKGEGVAVQKLRVEFERGLTSDEHNRLRKQAYYPRAVHGDVNAQYWMGFLSLNVDKDAAKALYWYEKAASQGNTEAMLALADGYSDYFNDPENGCKGFGLDTVKERYWKVKAAEKGNCQAKVDLALDYFIEGDKENALKMYQQATASNECKILMRAYKGLADIYGDILDTKRHNVERQKECLVRVLEMKQNNIHDMGAYDEAYYASAAYSLGSIYMREYEKTKDPVARKRAVYCYMLSYTCGNSYARNLIEKSGYALTRNEIDVWQNHARTLSFYLP